MKKNWKKNISKLLLGCLGATMLSTAAIAFADELPPAEITIWLNGAQIESNVIPVSENDRTLVPFRAVFEAMGAEVFWDDTTQTASMSLNNITIETTIDHTMLKKNGKDIKLEVPSRLIEDRTMVPVRAISEGLGAVVDWNEDKQQVLITYTAPVVAATKPTATPKPTAGDIKGLLTKKDLELFAQEADKLRNKFEQKALVSAMTEDKDYFKQLFSTDLNNSKEALDTEWTILCNSAMIQLMAKSDHAYEFDKEDLDALLLALNQSQTDANMLFDQFYSVSIEKINQENIILFTSKAPALESLSTYGAIVLDKNKDLHLYLLESSTNNNYFFCEPTEKEHKNLGVCKNTKEAFLNMLASKLTK